MPGFILNIIVGLIFSLIIIILSYKINLLTISGSFGAVITGTMLFGFGGIKFALPIICFFISSNLLGRINITGINKVSTRKVNQRNFIQVLCNGGLAAFSSVFYFYSKNELFLIFFIASIAEAASDTWATEIGTSGNYRTVSISSFKRVEQGLSGGISLQGLAGALAGSIFIAALSLFWINYLSFMIITFSGFIGCIIDSFLGDILQVKYKCNICGKIVETRKHCNNYAIKNKGFMFFNNDSVNLVSSLLSSFLAVLISNFVKG